MQTVKYIRVFWRIFNKHQYQVFATTSNVGMGLSFCFCVFLLNQFNQNFDKVMIKEGHEHIYLNHGTWPSGDGKISRNMFAPFGFGPTAKDNISGVKEFSRYILEGVIVGQGDRALNELVSFADPTIFDMFNLNIARGVRLEKGNFAKCVVNEEIASKYFNGESAIGKQLHLRFSNGKEFSLEIIGVLAPIPSNNSLTPSILTGLDIYLRAFELSNQDWKSWRAPSTFISFENEPSTSDYEDKLREFEEIRRKNWEGMGEDDHFELVPLLEHFSKDEIKGTYTNLRFAQSNLKIFYILVGIVLLLGILNLIFLILIVILDNIRQLSIKRILGENIKGIVREYSIYVGLIYVIVLVISFGLTFLTFPFLQSIFIDMNAGATWYGDLDFSISDLGIGSILIFALILFTSCFLVTVASSLVILMKIKPLGIVKKDVNIGVVFKVLMNIFSGITTMVLTAILVITTSFIMNANYYRDLDFGFDYKDVITVGVDSARMEIFQSDLTDSRIVKVARSASVFGRSNLPVNTEIEGGEIYKAKLFGISEDYFEVFDMDYQGTPLGNLSRLDLGAVVDRKYVDETGIDVNSGPIIKIGDSELKVLGVVNEHLNNPYISNAYEPSVYVFKKSNQLVIEVRASDVKDMLSYLRELWQRRFPEEPFRGDYVADILLTNVLSETTNMIGILQIFFIGVFLLAIVNLIAISKLSTMSRVKEIAVRMTLGANKRNLAFYLNKHHLLLIFVFSSIGGIGGFLYSQSILETLFSNFLPPSVLAAILTIVLLLLIVCSLIFSLTFRLLIFQPVDVLRKE